MLPMGILLKNSKFRIIHLFLGYLNNARSLPDYLDSGREIALFSARFLRFSLPVLLHNFNAVLQSPVPDLASASHRHFFSPAAIFSGEKLWSPASIRDRVVFYRRRFFFISSLQHRYSSDSLAPSPPTRLSVCLSVYLCVCLCVCPSVCLTFLKVRTSASSRFSCERRPELAAIKTEKQRADDE